MKKKIFIPLLITTLFSLSSCGYIFQDLNGDPFTPIEPGDPEEPDTPVTPPSSDISVVNIEISDKNTYEIGDIYDVDKQLSYLVTYSDGSTSETLPDGAYIHTYPLLDEEGNEVDTSKPFDRPLSLSSRWVVTYEGFPYASSEDNIKISVRSGFDNPLATLEAVDIVDNTVVKKDSVYAECVNYDISLYWKDYGKEIFHFDSTSLSDNRFKLTLIKTGSTDNVVNNTLEADNSYQPSLEIFKNGISEYKHDLPVFKIYSGSYKLANPSFTSYDMDMELLDGQIQMKYSKSVGDLNILVIPINLMPAYGVSLDTMNQSTLDKINSYFFDDEDNNVTSLKEYFYTSSYGKLNINGVVAPIYSETNIPTSFAGMTANVAQLNDKSLPVALYQIFTGALNNAYNELDIDWSKYDLDNDSYFDSIHFITNYKGASWGSTFWPQFGYKLDNAPIIKNICKEEISANVGFTYQFREESNPIKGSIYAMHTLESLTDPMVAIHEQGHVFGIQDYYDYTNSCGTSRDYVGGADMQSRNVFDYNAFSKFSLGWASPIVVDGTVEETTIEINSFADSGEFIVIPANDSTYNKSAFDEYFMIELFSNKENNNLSWTSWEDENSVSLGNGGIRLYHVDARVVGCNSGEFLNSSSEDVWHQVDYLDELPTNSSNTLDCHVVGTNNSYDYTAYAGYPYSDYSNYKLLTLIQKGGTNTFANPSGNNALSVDDLYQTGDTFSFEDAKSFLLKSGTASTMDNGELFPYTITFVNVNENSATIKIVKN